MPLSRLAQYQHCLFRRNAVRTTWSNSGAIDSRFLQTGGSVRIGDGANEGLWMCIKNSGQVATYDLQGGDFRACAAFGPLYGR